MRAWLVSGEVAPLGLQTANFSLWPHLVFCLHVEREREGERQEEREREIWCLFSQGDQSSQIESHSHNLVYTSLRAPKTITLGIRVSVGDLGGGEGHISVYNWRGAKM